MKLYASTLKDLLNMKDDEEIIIEQFEKLYPNGRTYALKVTVVEGEKNEA